ncbi:2-oxo acid dehydrogenase subunit E2, partial [bacterium]|nr:2-oxo acid dehydrogenase subunit E2 [bacterium]
AQHRRHRPPVLAAGAPDGPEPAPVGVGQRAAVGPGVEQAAQHPRRDGLHLALLCLLQPAVGRDRLLHGRDGRADELGQPGPCGGDGLLPRRTCHRVMMTGAPRCRVRGTGPHGRILLDDLTPHLTPVAVKKAPEPERPASDLGVAGTRTKLVGLRRRIADHLVDSTRRIPHYSYIDECEVTDLVRLRAQLREPFARVGVKLTYLAFVVKAVARALKEVPVANSSLDEAANEIVCHDRYHVGIAVATPGGLIVPVVKDADKKDLPAIAADIERLSREAKAGRARPDDLKGGTFTVTSVGNVGGLVSTPIVNHPEVGILGIGKVVKRPVYDDHGRIRPADILYLSFAFDHRVVDGAVCAVFGNAVARHLRSPALLLLPENYGA